jgi:4-amino-4-deoxy-L-arabinose transferase-like glycosyltransferase
MPERKLLLSLAWGLPLALLVSSVWYGPVIARHGWPFINEFFIQHHFARYFSNKYQHPQPFWYYFPIILMLSIPWTLFLVEALIRSRHLQWGNEIAAKSRFFTLVWLVLPILFFSFSGSKLPAYILPSLPAAALLIGERLSNFVSEGGSKLTMRITAVLCLLVGIGAVLYEHQAHRASFRCAVMVVVPVILLGSFILVSAGKRLLNTVLLAAIPLAVSVTALSCAVDGIASRESVKELISRAAREGYADAPLVMFSRIERSSEFYAAGRVVYGPDGDPLKVENPEEVIAQVRVANGPLLLIVPLGSLPRMESISEVETKLIAENGRNGIVVATLRK